MTHLTERYQSDLLGVLSCYDRMIITGALPGACYAGGMTSFLNFRHIRIFDYAKLFADPWRERLRQCAHEIADAQNVSIEHVNKSHIRKEDLVAQVIKQRGKHPGLVHILSAMEACSAYKPWHVHILVQTEQPFWFKMNISTKFLLASQIIFSSIPINSRINPSGVCFAYILEFTGIAEVV
ncbi:MAG: hypothetical protein MRK00_02140 [Nitrosomonas sp.]|nr:hypothetical protein [Nitrosomonas sp.]